jgi:hypothetical protein
MADFIPGEGYRLDIIAADETTIVDSWAGQIKGDVVAVDGNIMVDVNSGKIYGPMIGNIEDIDGTTLFDADLRIFKTDIIGDVKDSYGNLIVDSDLGTVTATVIGNIVDNDGNIIVDVSTKAIEAESIHGTFYGDLIGNVTTDSVISGTFTGDFNGTGYGEFFGEFTGSVTGNVKGDVTGDVTGNVTGNLLGEILADENTSLMSPPEPNYPQWNWLGGISHPIQPAENDIAKGPIIVIGAERSDSALRAHIQSYDGSPVVMLDIQGGSPYNAVFHGKLRGDVFDNDDNYIIYKDYEGITLTSPTGKLKLGSSADNQIDVDIRANKLIKRIPVDNGAAGEKFMAFRGRSDQPEAVRPLDYFGSQEVYVYNGTKFSMGGTYGFISDPDYAVNPESDCYPAGFVISLSNGTKFPKENLDNMLEFRSDGSLKVKTFHAKGTTFSERDSMTPKEGMIIFNKNSKKFQGYTGTEWVDLH